MAAAKGSMSTRKASWPSSEASGTNVVSVPAAVNASAMRVLFVDGEQDVGLHADDQRALGRRAFQRRHRSAAVRREIEAIHGAR